VRARRARRRAPNVSPRPVALAHRFVAAPLAAVGLAVAAASREAYLRVYYTAHYLDRAAGGPALDAPGVDGALVTAGGRAAAAAAGGATYALFKRALYAILLAPRASADRLFDAVAPPPPLTFARAWAFFGPATATRGSPRAFFAAHGVQAFAMATAAGWALLVAPVAHARAEGAIAAATAAPGALPRAAWGKRERDEALRREAARIGLALAAREHEGPAAAAAAPPPPPAGAPAPPRTVVARPGSAAAALGGP